MIKLFENLLVLYLGITRLSFSPFFKEFLLEGQNQTFFIKTGKMSIEGFFNDFN